MVLAQPPQRHGQAEARLGRLITGQRRREGGARIGPAALGQGGEAAGGQAGRWFGG
jgi:hypothetical protein